MGDIKATNNGIAQVGDHATATMHDQNNTLGTNTNAITPSLEEIRLELENLRKIVAGLTIADKTKVERALEDVKDELKKPQPDKQEVAEALERALKTAKKAGALTKEVQENIMPTLEKLSLWLSVTLSQFL